MRLWYRYNQFLCKVVFKLGFRLQVFQRENVPATGPILLISNHQSYLDPIICGVFLKRELDFIARDSLFRNPLFAWLIRSLNAFPIQRDQADLKAIRTVIERLKGDRAIVLFPEATRTTDGRIRTIKSGFELIARKASATVVPVVVDGAFEAWPRTKKLPSPKKIRAIYGQPWTPDDIKKLPRQDFILQVNQRLRDLQHQLRQQAGKEPFTYQPVKIEDNPT